MSLEAIVTFTVAPKMGGGLFWSLKVSSATVFSPSFTFSRITEPRNDTSFTDSSRSRLKRP